MIQNILTFCVKNDLTFVEGSIPSGKLVANDINRNSIYLVTPYDEAIVKANFQTNLQSDTPTSVLGILVNGKIAIDEIVPTSKSYYNLVKDWNIYEFKVPSTTLSFISRNRTGKIGINFSIEQRLVPIIKDSYGEYQGEILSQSQGQALTESGYYINKTIDFELDTGDVVIYDLNDILVLTKQERPLEDIQVKISAYSNRGSTPTTLYSVDPSLLNDNFETIEPSLTTQIVQQVNDNTGDIVLLFQNVGVNNATLVDFENRISVNEQDIDTAEGNITNLQGRMATAESDIEDIEDGTTIVEKALKDSLGNVIKSTYANKLDLGYSSSNNRIAITLKSYDGTSLDADLINLPKATTSADGLLAKEDKAYIDGLPSDLALKENKSEKGVANGYASLDSGAKIPSSQLPDSILGQLEYKGTFNPSSGYPASPEKGWFYISIANALISGADYKVGDWAVYNGVSWDKVDNTDAVASVNGKLGAVILYGNEIQVGNGDTWTVEQRIVNIYAELNNRYTKAQTYSNAEIEQRITDLLGLANLQDTAIEFTPSDYELDYNGTVVSTFPATLISDYNWVFVRVLVGSQEEYTIFKPSVSTTGVGIDLPLIQKDVFAQIERVNDDFNFALYKKADNTLSSTTASMRMWGIKLDGINATEITYEGGTVEEALDSLLVPEYITATHEALQSEITATNAFEIKDDSGELVKITGNTLPTNDIPTLKSMGIKNDSGVLFAKLTNEEITEQLGIWAEQGYPTHINKIISKSDNLFGGKFNTLTSLASENIISNSDLLIDSNADNIPDGFEYVNATDISLTNGIAKFTATAQGGHLEFQLSGFNNQTMYVFARFKADGNVRFANPPTLYTTHSGSGQFEFLSFVETLTSTRYPRVLDNRTSDWTPIEVDYIGAINITDLVSRGILPLGLTNNEYKEMIDNAIYDNVPLRESDFISVEPSVAYRLIKASENSAIHKVIEYTTDNQIVKVNSVDYSGNVKISSPITMNALTRKVKLISDLMDRVPNLVSNSDLLIDSNSDGIPDGFEYNNATYISLTNGIAKFTATARFGRIRPVSNVNFNTSDLFYAFANCKSNFTNVGLSKSTGSLVSHSGSGNFEFLSTIGVFDNVSQIGLIYDGRTSDWTPIEVDYIGAINITEFKDKGVADDNGTLFSRLTNGEIKDQMDLWVQNGFPDHVINALYPDGADSAIAFKCNDADATYSSQQIDELPLDITLRSGEYWQDGYIVKANGNAEASPLGKVFSAWNYGQIEAIYDSGVPADFKVKYAQNTSAQVSTHSEYLKEARERLDTLRVNQKQLIKKLGIDVDNDVYDSFVGITSEKFEYYQLDGIKSGNILKVEGRGQSVANLLVNTIASSITGYGLTITYDDTTGMFTVNGTTTSAGNIILKTGMNFGLPVGTTCQLMRYFDSGTINLNGSYCGYLITGTSVSNRINENSESLYDPYINGVGELKPDGANPNIDESSGQSLVFQVYKAGMVFTDFKFKVALYEGTKLLPFAMSETTNNTDVDVYNRTANLLDMGTSDIAYTEVSGITISYNALAQEFVISGTATANNTITLKASVLDVISGDRVSIKRVFQSGDITAVGTLPTIELFDGTSVVLANSIYKMTAPDGQTPTPDVSFNTGTISSDGTLTLRLQFKDDDVFDNYRFRLMIHDKSTDIGYVAYNRILVGSLTAKANETDSFEFSAIDFGVLEFIPKNDKLNVVFGDTIADTDNSVLEYNAGIQSANRKLSVLESRITALDNPFRDKVIAIWGDSRESNNPTSDPSGVGDQKDTSYPALLAKKLGATVLNFGLSGGAWAENTVQQDAASAIVNRVLTEDTSASADVIIISSMNDFKLATPLGSPTEATDKTTFYGAMRMTYKRLANKYPSKKIWLVLPQKRYDETVNYGGGDYLSYRKAQIDVAREYGIPTIDLYNNFPNSKAKITSGVSFYDTNMLNDTHFSAVGNDLVAELITRSLLGNGNSGVVETLPILPTTNGTYTLKLTVLNGVNTFSWVLDS